MTLSGRLCAGISTIEHGVGLNILSLNHRVISQRFRYIRVRNSLKNRLLRIKIGPLEIRVLADKYHTETP